MYSPKGSKPFHARPPDLRPPLPTSRPKVKLLSIATNLLEHHGRFEYIRPFRPRKQPCSTRSRWVFDSYAWLFAFFMIEHRSLPIDRLQETHVIQIFCSRFCERASIRSPQGTISAQPFSSDRGIYDAAIILGRIPGGTKPMWSRFLCTRLTIEHGRQFARLLSTVDHRPSATQLSERDHARATRASLLAGISPGHGGPHPRALKYFSPFSFFISFFVLFFIFLTKLK